MELDAEGGGVEAIRTRIGRFVLHHWHAVDG